MKAEIIKYDQPAHTTRLNYLMLRSVRGLCMLTVHQRTSSTTKHLILFSNTNKGLKSYFKKWNLSWYQSMKTKVSQASLAIILASKRGYFWRRFADIFLSTTLPIMFIPNKQMTHHIKPWILTVTNLRLVST